MGFNHKPEGRVFPVAGVDSPAILDYPVMCLLRFCFFFFLVMIELNN